MKSRILPKFFIYFTLIIGGIIIGLPFYYMFITAFKSQEALSSMNITLFVWPLSLEPIRILLTGSNYLLAAWNSFLIALASTAGTILLAPMAGYAFEKHNFPGRDKIFFLLLATMMIPGAVLLVPGFLLSRDFGWINTFYPLVIPGLCGSFGVFLSKQFIASIPNELIKAARVDGCSEIRIFFQIIMPLCKPLLATLGILTFLGSWNSFLGPMIILMDDSKYTLPLVISLLQGRYSSVENVQMAGSLLAIAPVLVLFFIFQKQIVSSLANTGLKG